MTTNGINGGGFEAAKPAGNNTINAHYSDNTGSAFAATDKSSQDGAGVGNGGK
jgi:hypothetical protein